MNRTQQATRVKALVCAGLLLFAVTPSALAREVSERFKTGADARLDLSNVSGDIQISGWELDEVLIEGELHNNAEIQLEHTARHVTIKVVKKKGVRRMGSSELTVQVPFTAELSLYGVSADIEVEDVRGAQRIEVVSGDIDVRGFDDDVRIRSVNGDVDLQGLGSAKLVTVVSVSGDIEIRDVAGELEATSISGDMRVEGGEFSRVRLNSTSGEVKFSGDISSSGRLSVENISGDIDIDLPSAVDLDVEIESFSGEINNCMGEKARRKNKYGPGQILRFTRGEGDRALRVQALSGSVELCAK